MSMSMSMSSNAGGSSLANTSKTSASSNNAANQQESVQEYSIRVPKNGRKKFNLMRFNATLNVDFGKWTNVKMERENNQREFRGMDEEQPKFGAGSEFGRDAREEARRKKLGYIARKYKPEDQPWLLRAGGKNGKKFKGIREGGVSENASYYVFTHAADGAIEAFPLQEWYNFTPIQCYKALSAEEAEQEFGKRNRVLNFFSLMMRKRLRGDEDGDGDNGMGADGDDIKLSGGGKSGKSKSGKDKELKISEMDEWMETSSDDDDSNGEGEEKDKEKEKDKIKNGKQKQRKKKIRDTDAEAFEDSDDGDEEGRELDYISSSSESDIETEKQLQGVAEEKALRKLLTSDEDSEDEENKSNKSNSSDDEKDKDKDDNDKKKDKDDKDDKDHKDEGNSKNKHANKKKAAQLKKKDFNKNKNKKDKKESSSSLSSDSDSDNDNNKKKNKDNSSNNNSRSSSPITTDNKRKFDAGNNVISQMNAKKQKLDMPAASLPTYLMSSSDSGITEDAVRRYLMRKPMTTTELLQKFKTKKTGLNSEQLVNIMTQILKKINPVKQTIKGKMYLSIKQ